MRGVNYVKVQGQDGLVRDPESGAILSINNNEFDAYKAKRQKEIERQKLIDQQVQEINELKSDMLEIKQMLSILIKGK